MALGGRPELLSDPSRELTQVDPLGIDLEYVGVELREIQEVSGELRQSLHLLAHRSHEFLPRRRVRLLLVEQLDEPPQ